MKETMRKIGAQLFSPVAAKLGFHKDSTYTSELPAYEKDDLLNNFFTTFNKKTWLENGPNLQFDYFCNFGNTISALFKYPNGTKYIFQY